MKETYNTLATKGVISKELLRSIPGLPSQERRNKGPVAIIECVQEIPCNPCESACHLGAIKIGEDITALPVLDEDKCTGCGLCIPACPGLAIFVIDFAFSEKEALVSLPHEFLPLPQKNDTVNCLDREGKIVSQGKVVRVTNPIKYDRTPVISVAVPREFADEIRAIVVDEEQSSMEKL